MYDNVPRWMPRDPTDDKSTLVQVMAWCRQATSHYLSQCLPSSMSPNGVIRPQCVNGYINFRMTRILPCEFLHQMKIICRCHPMTSCTYLTNFLCWKWIIATNAGNSYRDLQISENGTPLNFTNQMSVPPWCTLNIFFVDKEWWYVAKLSNSVKTKSVLPDIRL